MGNGAEPQAAGPGPPSEAEAGAGDDTPEAAASDEGERSPGPSETATGAEPGTLAGWAVRVLREPSPHAKRALTERAVALWRAGELEPSGPGDGRPPDKPARDGSVAARALPKRGKGGSLKSRQCILHSLVHIENIAVDLAWDAIARFGRAEGLPRAFFDDFATVAEDECRHYALLEERLRALGSRYGAFPSHDGLWDDAAATAGDVRARLAVEHCVHEARGLDVLPQTIARFRNNGDAETADLLEGVVYPEEIGHVRAGLRWFAHVCEREGEADPVRAFHASVRAHFRGPLKPPFNAAARAAAGFTPEWYEPLADKPRTDGGAEAAKAVG